MTPCDRCIRGWVPDGDWYKACPVCGGAGVLTAERLAKILDEWPVTIKRVWNLKKRNRRRTLERVLSKVCVFLNQPEEMQRIYREMWKARPQRSPL